MLAGRVIRGWSALLPEDLSEESGDRDVHRTDAHWQESGCKIRRRIASEAAHLFASCGQVRNRKKTTRHPATTVIEGFPGEVEKGRAAKHPKPSNGKILMWEFPKIRGTFFRVAYKKDPTI